MIDRNNIYEYLDKNYEWLFKCEGPAFRADIVRLLLLQKYGGVYADAATFCCINIIEFSQQINFDRFWGFDIKSFNNKRDERTLSSWFYICQPDTYIINKFTDMFIEAAKKNPRNHPYFLHHSILTELVRNDNQFGNWYSGLTKISGFNNRIDAGLLSKPITKKLNFPEWFHTNDIMFCMLNNKFKIIKLRHRNTGTKEELLKDGTTFRALIDYYLYPKNVKTSH